MKREASKQAYEEALRYIPGGVNSPVRALRSVGEAPLFIDSAQGTLLTDIDGNIFTDYCLSWGVFLAGHGHPSVIKAAKEAIDHGTSYGIPSPGETVLAKAVNNRFSSMDQVRFVSSGTEAVMSAVRLARGFTGRDIIVKFDGCYHGHADHLLVSAGSGAVHLPGASSSGVPADFVRHTMSLPFNDKEAVERIFAKEGERIAAVIVEPVAANMGVVLPRDGFLELLRKVTSQCGALLIFDEVITGFRLSNGGAQARLGITPDITTLGKIIGGGFPAAAFGGRRDIMGILAPDGPVYQAGTLSGNPVAMAAGLATLDIIGAEGFYEELESKSARFLSELRRAVEGDGVQLNSIGSMFTLFFSDKPVESFDDAKNADQKRFARFFRKMLASGIYVSPSQFEASFVSSAHSTKELERFTEAAAKAIR